MTPHRLVVRVWQGEFDCYELAECFTDTFAWCPELVLGIGIDHELQRHVDVLCTSMGFLGFGAAISIDTLCDSDFCFSLQRLTSQ
jgi:hypothetical protein